MCIVNTLLLYESEARPSFCYMSYISYARLAALVDLLCDVEASGLQGNDEDVHSLWHQSAPTCRHINSDNLHNVSTLPYNTKFIQYSFMLMLGLMNSLAMFKKVVKFNCLM